MNGRVYGYARVSTKGQHEDRQLVALREYGVEARRIIVEKQSGKDFDRPLYQKLLKKLRPGDTLVITSIDRLGRNYSEIIDQWRIISKERGVAIVVLDMPLLNTQENAELVSRLITDLVLQVFSYVAETERENIRRRQREGIEAAKVRGVRFGRPRLEMPPDFPEIVRRWQDGVITSRTAARLCGISRNTFFRRVRELTAEKTIREHTEPISETEENKPDIETPDASRQEGAESRPDRAERVVARPGGHSAVVSNTTLPNTRPHRPPGKRRRRL